MELALTVSPRSVSGVRRFVEGLVAEAAEGFGADPDLAARVALTVHELLENVALYAQHRHGTLCLAATEPERGRRLTITVTNSATPAHVARLKHALRDAGDGSDGMAHYLSLMRQTVGRDQSGLGLARIRAEADMLLSLSIEEDEVSVSASTALPEPPIAKGQS
jgi:anti-sigma regulatory factor (Ser/Thr protein kinase)